MAVNVGTLVIDLEAGTSNFTESMHKAADTAAKTAANISDSLHQIGEAGKEVVEVIAGMVATFHTVAAATATAATSGENLVNAYRALRLALSPTIFTAATLALGALTEKTIELTIARAKLIDQQALLAATSGRSIGSVEQIATIAKIAGGSASNLGILGGDPAKLREAAEAFASIEDPVKRAAKAVELFGKENAALALSELGPRYLEAARAVDQYGLSLDEVSRNQISRMKRDWDDIKDFFTDFTVEKTWLDNLATGLEVIGGVLNDLGHKASDLFDKFIPIIPLLRGATAGTPALAAAPGIETATQRIFAEDLTAQETAIRDRQKATLDGMKAQREAAKAEIDADYARLNDAVQRKALTDQEAMLTATQMQAARQRYVALSAQIEAEEEAEEAAKEAAAKAKQLAEWQAKAPQRLQELWETAIQRTITTPIAAELFRGRAEVMRDSDRTTVDERTQRAAITGFSLQNVVATELKKFGEAWEKGVAADSERQQKFFEQQLSRSITKDEQTVEATRSMQEEFTANEIQMAQITAQPGEEIATAQQILDIRLKANEAARNEYLTEGEIIKLNTERQKAFDAYNQAVAQHTANLERSALAAGGAYQQQLRDLQAQLEALNEMAVTSENIRDIENARQALNDQILENLKNQLLQMGSLRDGVQAFFVEMQKSAVTAAQIIYNAMNSTLDKLSHNIAMLATGGKANFAEMFKDIGQQMVESSTKALLQKGIGALGTLFPKLGSVLPKQLQKLDGQSENTALWVQLKTAGGPAMPGGIGVGGIQLPPLPGFGGSGGGVWDESEGSPGAIAAASKGLGGFVGFLSKLAGAFGGAEAEGGEVSPGSAYLVGERGPELYTPGTTGSITPADETNRLMTAGRGDVHYYTIDARGTDPALTEQRTRQAIVAAHNSAITTSTQVQQEKAHRMPPQPRR